MESKTKYPTLRAWRDAILGDPANGVSTEALYDLHHAWSDAAEFTTGVLIRNEEALCEHPALHNLTYLIATVCDLGPARIDPSPLTDYLAKVATIRARQLGKQGRRPANASDEELRELNGLINRAYNVLNRLTHAWVAIERRSEVKPDGPCSDFRWRHDGVESVSRMCEGAWRLCDYLFSHCVDKTADFGDLGEPIYGDREHFVDASGVSSLRRDANRFFRDNGIPLHLTCRGEKVTLAESVEE